MANLNDILEVDGTRREIFQGLDKKNYVALCSLNQQTRTQCINDIKNDIDTFLTQKYKITSPSIKNILLIGKNVATLLGKYDSIVVSWQIFSEGRKDLLEKIIDEIEKGCVKDISYGKDPHDNEYMSVSLSLCAKADNIIKQLKKIFILPLYSVLGYPNYIQIYLSNRKK